MKEDIPSLQDTVLCRNDVKGKWLSDTILPSYIHTVLYPCLGESVEKINATVSKFNPSLLMGTSLGGYYVFYADAPCATKVICNPAMNIAKLIRYKIGFGTYSYFVERQDGNTEYTLDEAVCGRFTEFESSHKAVCGTKNYALFAVHDKLIGDADMLGNMALVFESGYQLLLDSKGGHRLRAAALNLLHREISK